VLAAALLLCAAQPNPAWAGPELQMIFQSPAGAVQALIDAFKSDDQKEVLAIFGPAGEEIISSGDAVADRTMINSFLESYAQKHQLVEERPDRVILDVGQDDWPFPIPLIKYGDFWYFDAEAGREEILNRRIGKNELETIQVCLAIVDAQREYAMQDWDGNGLNEYAQTFLSTPGKRDGLYWEAEVGQAPSPLGPFVAEAAAMGYRKRADAKPTPYRGYYYKILKAQGKSANGGAYDYVVKGRMIGGFALVAHPADYGNSGVMTFIVNHDGVVYQKDLGEETVRLVMAMTAFDPDPTWSKLQESVVAGF
jgi:hypothetical protein